MAVIPFVDGYVLINAVDLSDHITSANIDIGGAELDASAITDDWDVTILGRKNWTFNVELMDDFAASKTDATIWAAFNAGTAITVIFQPVTGTVTATNPRYTGSVIPSKSPVGGGAGALMGKSVAFKGTGALTRATST